VGIASNIGFFFENVIKNIAQTGSHQVCPFL